jgi:rifampicin phosphotransferase
MTRSETAPAYVLWFRDAAATDIARVGGKAANLARLVAADLPVPPGFAVTAEAYGDFLRASGLTERILAHMDGVRATEEVERRSAEVRRLIVAQTVPDAITEQVRAAYGRLGDGATPVAVRSSATAEDLPEASFAGQQDTYLNIRGAAAVLDAVRRCWASLWTARAVAYRLEHGFAHDQVLLAVVVQQMVEPDVAGVMFTANPVSGRRDETVINASYGLGEAVVSGVVTPDTFVVQPRTGRIREREIATKAVEIVYAVRQAPELAHHREMEAVRGAGETDIGPEGTVERALEPARATRACLDDDAARNLAWLGTRVAAHFGAPQDIEWARAGGEFYLLQSRPITTLGELAHYDPRDHWTRAIFIEILPDAPSPLFCSVLVPILTGMLDFTFRRLGRTPPSDIQGVAVFYHQAYFNMRYIRAALADLPKARAEDFAQRIANPFTEHYASPTGGRRHIPGRAELSMALNMVRAANTVPRSIQREIRAYRDALAPYQQRDPREASDEEIIRTLHHIAYDILPDLVEWDFLLIAALGFVLRLGEGLARRTDLPDPDRLAGILRSGLTGNITMETNKALWALMELARAEPAVARAIQDGPDEALVARVRTAAGDGSFARALAAFLDTYGHREIRMDIVYPSWREDPAPVLRFVRAYLAAPNAPSPEHQEHALADARRKGAGEVERALARTLLGRLVHRRLFRWAMGRAEALGAFRDTMHYEWTRSFPLLRHWLETMADRWVARGLLDRRADIYCLSIPDLLAWIDDPRPMTDLAARRRRQWDRDRARPWPVEIRGGEEIYDEAPTELAVLGHALRGVPGSPGQATGTVRVVRGPEDFGRLQPGEILVAPLTNPVWTPLFAIAGGLVTDTGGILSHGAIVAREYGIPAVMGASGATLALHDGQRVTVDGTRGVVTVA